MGSHYNLNRPSDEQIIKLIRQGMKNADIARRFNITDHKRIKRIRDAFKAENQGEKDE